MKTRKYNIYDYLRHIRGRVSGGNYGGGYYVDNNAAMRFNDWFYMSNGVLHCRYPFAGDSEVSAYQATDSSTFQEQIYSYIDETQVENTSIMEAKINQSKVEQIANSSLMEARLKTEIAQNSSTLEDRIKSYIEQYYISKPVVLYETDGSTGLIGVNNNQLGYNWQLENYDFTPYKYLKCYFKEADYKISSNSLTPAMIIELPLDEAVLDKSDNSTTDKTTPCDIYVAGGTAVSPSDQNQIYTILVAVDSTKTKFQVVCQNIIYGTTYTNVNNNGRYCYKIIGCFD